MANRGVGHNSGRLWLTRTYNVQETDPEIDRCRALYNKERKLRETDVAVLGGLAASTVKNMFGGKTRRPQHATFAKVLGAMGYRYEITRDEQPDYEAEIPKARGEFKAYRDGLAKKKARKNGHAKNGHARSAHRGIGK
jgi:hypothetical protein